MIRTFIYTLALTMGLFSCQDDTLDSTFHPTFSSGLSTLPDEINILDTVSISLPADVVRFQWYVEEGRSTLIQDGEQTELSVVSEDFSSTMDQAISFVPTSVGEHRGEWRLTNALGQTDTIAYALDVVQVLPEFNARVFGNTLYLRQQIESPLPQATYQLRIDGDQDFEAVWQIDNMEGEYRLGDQVEIPYQKFLDADFELNYQIAFESNEAAETVNFTFTDQGNSSIETEATFLLTEAEAPQFLPAFNARMLSADSLQRDDATFFLYLKQQSTDRPVPVNYEVQLTPTAGFEASYRIEGSDTEYFVGDIATVSYDQFVENDYLLPITVSVLEGNGDSHRLNWIVTDPGQRSLQLTKTFKP